MIRQLDRLSHDKTMTEPLAPSQVDQSPWAKRLTMIWLTGLVVLLPVDLIKLPLNMNLVDVWIIMGLPVLWLTFIRRPHIISFSYVLPMWLIFVASFISTFAAPAPGNSLIVILKEVYVYIWFITVTAVLATLSPKDLRRILAIWAGVAFFHGFVIVGQFLSRDFWWFMVSLTRNAKEFAIYRPSGLFMNANSAALFQLLGFVPLVLTMRSQKKGMFLGLLYLLTMMLTGSMGATLGFTAGLTVAIIAIALIGRLTLILKMFVQSVVIALIVGGLLAFVVSHNVQYQQHFEHIFLGRAERSSGGRLDLWQRGVDALIGHDVLLWGVGPENFREVDAKMTDNQLHNDFLAFFVERGLVGALGLGLLAFFAAGRAGYMVFLAHKYPDQNQLTVVVFLAAIAAIGVESLTHQVFHFRALWLVLALQEAMLYQMKMAESERVPTARALGETPDYVRGFVVRPDISGG